MTQTLIDTTTKIKTEKIGKFDLDQLTSLQNEIKA